MAPKIEEALPSDILGNFVEYIFYADNNKFPKVSLN